MVLKSTGVFKFLLLQMLIIASTLDPVCSFNLAKMRDWPTSLAVLNRGAHSGSLMS
jgi:hypothetical protein